MSGSDGVVGLDGACLFSLHDGFRRGGYPDHPKRLMYFTHLDCFSDIFTWGIEDRTDPIFFVQIPSSSLVIFAIIDLASLLSRFSVMAFSMEFFSTLCLIHLAAKTGEVGASIIRVAAASTLLASNTHFCTDSPTPYSLQHFGEC